MPTSCWKVWGLFGKWAVFCNDVPTRGKVLELCAPSWLPDCRRLIIEESAAGKLIHPKSRLSTSCACPSGSPRLRYAVGLAGEPRCPVPGWSLLLCERSGH